MQLYLFTHHHRIHRLLMRLCPVHVQLQHRGLNTYIDDTIAPERQSLNQQMYYGQASLQNYI
jgi:hypothetical protein